MNSAELYRKWLYYGFNVIRSNTRSSIFMLRLSASFLKEITIVHLTTDKEKEKKEKIVRIIEDMIEIYRVSNTADSIKLTNTLRVFLQAAAKNISTEVNPINISEKDLSELLEKLSLKTNIKA